MDSLKAMADRAEAAAEAAAKAGRHGNAMIWDRVTRILDAAVQVEEAHYPGADKYAARDSITEYKFYRAQVSFSALSTELACMVSQADQEVEFHASRGV